MKTLLDIQNFDGVRVLVRTDYNVPIRDGNVVDDFRIKMSLPTIDYLCSRGAKVILVSHLESVDGKNGSLEPVARHMIKLGQPVLFIKNIRNARAVIEEQMKDGECVLIENLRTLPGEKKNDPKFAAELASLADIYVNEAFSVSHRAHASIVGVPQIIPGYAGFQFEKEVSNLSKAFSPAHPFFFALGGAKFETKMPLLEKFINIADKVFVGGALANDFYREKGYEIGQSTVSKTKFDLKKYLESEKLIIPVDIVNQDHDEKMADSLSKTDKIFDAGTKTIEGLKDKIKSSKFILWNGPLGLYEDGYQGATLELAKIIATAVENGATAVIGGGDTVAAVATLGIQDKFTFISTAGGAMLDYLAMGTLPGIGALD